MIRGGAPLARHVEEFVKVTPFLGYGIGSCRGPDDLRRRAARAPCGRVHEGGAQNNCLRIEGDAEGIYLRQVQSAPCMEIITKALPKSACLPMVLLELHGMPLLICRL